MVVTEVMLKEPIPVKAETKSYLLNDSPITNDRCLFDGSWLLDECLEYETFDLT